MSNLPISEILETGLLDSIVKIKYDVPNDRLDLFDNYYKEIDSKLEQLVRQL